MERVYRTGLDIDVALSTAARRVLAAAHDGQAAGAALTAESAIAAVATAPASSATAAPTLRSRVKRWLRRPAAIGLRLAKPFLRPIAFRTRRYLTEAMQQNLLRAAAETTREVQRATSDLLREVQSARELLRQEILAAQTQPMEEQRRIVAGLLREQTATRDLVRELLAREQRPNAADITEAVAAGQGQLVLALAPRLDRLEQYGYASARRAIVHCAAGEVMVKTESGFVMCADSDLSLLACLADTGDVERGTRLLIERLLQPGDIFVDVGANVGLHTIAAGRALQGRGRIIAFEPFEATRKLLEKTVWINGLDAITDIHGSAVSDREGVQTLFLGPDSGHHSLYRLDDAAPETARVTVPGVRLDSVIASAQPVNLIKIDVEGAELDVLGGAREIIRANQDIALIVEFGPAHLRRTGRAGADWLAAFTELGLAHRAIDAASGALVDLTLAQLEAAESTNLLFARPHAAAWARIGAAA